MRSGNIFLQRAIACYSPIFTIIKDGIDYEDPQVGVHTMHIPHIIGHEDLMTVTILRDPYECIASLIYMKNARTVAGISDNEVDQLANEYAEYLDKVEESLGQDNFMAISFNELVSNPVDTLNEIFEKFGMIPNSGVELTKEEIYETVLKRLEEEGLMDKARGHMPRTKDPIRNSTDKYIKTLDLIIDPVFKRYQKLLKMIG